MSANHSSVPSTTGTSIEDLDAAICRMSRDINVAQYRLLLLIREFDDRFGWAKWSFRNCSEWLAWRCGITLSAAREKVRTAQALRGLPQISQAFAEGRLSYSKVRALTRAADRHNEDLLLAYALTATATQVEERCRQTRNVQPGSAEHGRRSWARRTLSVWRNAERGTMTISLEVPLEVGEIVTRAIDRAIEAGEAANGPEFQEVSWQTQQADALVAVARCYLDGPAAGAAPAASTADHYQVVVHVDEQALRGGPGRSDLPIETVKRLVCDGSVVPVVENGAGEPLNVGRKQRTVPPAIRRALWSRDRGCSFPGCHNSRYIDAHHVQHWSDGGETSLDNLVLLCSHHHRLVHEGGYDIRRDAEGQMYFQRADGRVIPRCGYDAEDARPDAVVLQGTSAEGWLAGLVQRRMPSAEVREHVLSYQQPFEHSGNPDFVQRPRSGILPWPVGARGRLKMKITHFLYNAFLLEESGARIAIDPGQNLWLFKLHSLVPESEWPTITHLVITHGDPDHHWQSDRVARASGAHVVCGRGLTRAVDGATLVVAPRGRGLTSWVPFENLHPLDVGESVDLDGVRIDAVKTEHGPIAVPILGFTFRAQPGAGERVGIGSMGFRITAGGTSVLNLGDSILLPEWKDVSADVLMVPIGGFGRNTWTMDVDEALQAVEWISPRWVIPCHYNVPFLWKRRFAVADDQRFKREVERSGARCAILGYGESLTV